MNKVMIAGVGNTNFGAFPEISFRSLSTSAVDTALADANVSADSIEKIFFGNASAGIMLHQEMVRGQVVFRNHPLSVKPLVNVENACASGGSALHLASQAIKYGELDVALVVGVEKLHHEQKDRAFQALWGSTDVSEIGEYAVGEASKNSILMDYYAGVASQYLVDTGSDVTDFARIAVKNRNNAALNPIAQYKKPQTIEQVLSSRMISEPLTLPMCAPLTDGATAIVVCSEAFARKNNLSMVEVKACTLAASPGLGMSPVEVACAEAYEVSGYGAEDLDCVELHDAAAPAEMLQYSEIGLCKPEDAKALLRNGDTEITGRIPVNTSGGLLSRGHALGATGCVQVAEIYEQIMGKAGKRQLANAKLGMAVNGGGWMDDTYILTVCTILEKVH